MESDMVQVDDRKKKKETKLKRKQTEHKHNKMEVRPFKTWMFPKYSLHCVCLVH